MRKDYKVPKNVIAMGATNKVCKNGKVSIVAGTESERAETIKAVVAEAKKGNKQLIMSVTDTDNPKRPSNYRVKLLDLPDFAQAVWHVRDEKLLELKVYGFNSLHEAVELIAPFAFESETKRDEAYFNTEKLEQLSKWVFVTQMALIDPELNTINFK